MFINGGNAAPVVFVWKYYAVKRGNAAAVLIFGQLYDVAGEYAATVVLFWEYHDGNTGNSSVVILFGKVYVVGGGNDSSVKLFWKFQYFNWTNSPAVVLFWQLYDAVTVVLSWNFIMVIQEMLLLSLYIFLN